MPRGRQRGNLIVRFSDIAIAPGGQSPAPNVVVSSIIRRSQSLLGTLHGHSIAAVDENGAAGYAIDDLDLVRSGVGEEGFGRTRYSSPGSCIGTNAPRRARLEGVGCSRAAALYRNPRGAVDEDGAAGYPVDDLDLVRSGIGKEGAGCALNGIRLGLNGCESGKHHKPDSGDNRKGPHGSLLSAKCDGCDVHKAVRIHPCYLASTSTPVGEAAMPKAVHGSRPADEASQFPAVCAEDTIGRAGPPA